MKGIFRRAVESKSAIQIIYIDSNNLISQRTIRVLAVTESYIKAYCYTKKQFRIFKIENVLSADYIKHGA